MLNKLVIKECPLQCGKKQITYEEMIEVHLPKKCPKIKVRCECLKEMAREQIGNHRIKECTRAEVKCEVCGV